MAMENFPRSRFKAVDEDLLCCLCNSVPKTPLMASCQHICCPACVEGWATCPQCGIPVRPGEFAPPGRIIQNLYGKLELLCEFKGRGCDFRVPFGSPAEMEEHAGQCPKALCVCPHDGCSYTGMRETMPDHEAQCEHRAVYCELCAMAVKFNAAATHRTSACPMGEVECTCGQTMRRADKEQHVLRACPHSIPAPCPVLGCGRSVPQGEMEAHLSGSLVKHLKLLSVALQDRDGALQRLAEESQRAQKRLAEAEEKVAVLEAERRELSWYGMGLWRTEADGRCVWTIGNMTQKLKEASLKQHASAQGHVYLPMLLWSPQAYTHGGNGYRFSLRLDLGAGAAAGIFIHLHEGEHDDQLTWPFNMDYTVQLGSIVSQITQRDSYMHYTAQGRPPHELSWGWANFCSVEAVKEAVALDALEISIWFHASTVAGGYQPTAAPAGAYGAAHAPEKGRKPAPPTAAAAPAPPGYGPPHGAY